MPLRNDSSFRDLCSELLKAAALLIIALWALACMNSMAHSQIQRSFLNLSFENLPADCSTLVPTTYQVGRAAAAIGWSTTHANGSYTTTCGIKEEGVIEAWIKGFDGYQAHDGDVHVELNAQEESTLYQTVCVLEGDVITWEFAHRARTKISGGAEQGGFDSMAFQLADETSDRTSWTNQTNIVQVTSPSQGIVPGTIDCTIGGCEAPIMENGWSIYKGNFTWTAPTSLKRFGFVSISGALGNKTIGNFLDSISLTGISPIVEFDRDTAEGLEGEHTAANFPLNILVSGNIPIGETLSVTLKVVHQETNAADMSPSDEITIDIPAGDYAGTPFPVPMDILTDDIRENREKFKLEIVDKPGAGGYRVGSVTTCGDAGRISIVYTILDAHASIQKIGTFVDLVGGFGPDGTPIKNAGDRMDYEFIVTNTGDVALNNLIVTDSIIGLPVFDAARSNLDTNGHLLPGGVAIYSASYTLTQTDVDRGDIVNVANLSATLANYPSNPPIAETSNHNEPLPHIPAIGMVKVGAFDAATDDGDGLPDPGERIKFEITVTNDGNITAFNVQPNDPGPTFDGKKGTSTMSAFQPGPVTLLPGQSQIFTAYYTLTTDDIAFGSGITDGVANQAAASADGPNGEPLAASMPTPMKLTMPGFGVEKRAEITQTQRGGKVPYTLILKPLKLIQTTRIRLADVMPAGFVYIPGSTIIDGIPIEPLVQGRRLSWELDVEPEKPTEVSLVLGVSASVKHGTFTNIAQAERIDNDVVYRQIGKADVEIMPEPVFDCGDILGKVFNDRNRNGYQDQGEEGVPGTRVVSTNGMLITTDQYGRFSIACADLPEGRIGSNFILKLDPRSLPTGYRIISENPRVIRLTAGKTSQVNFSTSISRVVRLDLSSLAFLSSSTDLLPVWQQGIVNLLATLEAEPTILRISYLNIGENKNMANQRLKKIRNMIANMWKEKTNHYRLEIETRLVTNSAIASGTD